MRRDSGLDIGRLQRYLSQTVPDIGTIQSAEKFSDGQSNPTSSGAHLSGAGLN